MSKVRKQKTPIKIREKLIYGFAFKVIRTPPNAPGYNIPRHSPEIYVISDDKASAKKEMLENVSAYGYNDADIDKRTITWIGCWCLRQYVGLRGPQLIYQNDLSKLEEHLAELDVKAIKG